LPTGAVLVFCLLYLSHAGLLRRRSAARLEKLMEQRTAELRESEARYRRLFADIATPKLLLDPEGTVIDANTSACELCRRPRGELLGQPAKALGLAWLDAVIQRFAVQAGVESGSIAGSYETDSGDLRDLEVWVHPIRLQRRDMILVTAQDVTGLRQLQEERLRASKLESVGLLAGGIAHDFNNILAAVLGNISLARVRASRGEESSELLAAAEGSLLRAQRLTGQLLALSKGGEPVRSMTNVARLIQEAATFVLSGSQAVCRFEVAPELWPAEVDEGQLTQVIHNLVINADQAMPDGGSIMVEADNVRLSSTTETPLPPGPYVRVSVSDEGVGIPTEQLEKVFDPYFTTKEAGSGLGLATAYAIISKHGGHITCQSSPGEGTTFTIVIPASPETPVPELEAAEGAAAVGRGRVLVLEDEKVLQSLYTALLNELGYEPEVVADGEALLSAHAEARRSGSPYVAVLMDLTIRGGMGGRETIARLRQEDTSVRAIVASGYSNDPVLANYRQAGFVGVLRKPFTLAQLATALEAALGPQSGDQHQVQRGPDEGV
jgi:PAS domain S-box-containing protein